MILTWVKNVCCEGCLTCIQHFSWLGFKYVTGNIFNSWDSPLSFFLVLFFLEGFYSFLGGGNSQTLSHLKIVFFFFCF